MKSLTILFYFLAFPNTLSAEAKAEAKGNSCKVQFSSVYTKLKTDCPLEKVAKDSAQDPTHICKGVGPYNGYIYYSALGTLVQIVEGEKTILPLPEQGNDETFKRNLEWRLANGSPFAVIYRATQYSAKGLEAVEGAYMADKYKTGEKIFILGLKGFSNLKQELNPAMDKNSNERAREIADQTFCSKKLQLR